MRSGGHSGSKWPYMRSGWQDRHRLAGGIGVLEELASTTGGRAFILSDDSQLATVFGQIEEELHWQYVLTYRRSLAPSYDGFHHVQVAIRDRPNLRISSRAGYFARGRGSQ